MRALPEPVPLSTLAALVDGAVDAGFADTPIDRLAPLGSARRRDIAFLNEARYGREAAASSAGAMLVAAPLRRCVPEGCAAVIVADAYRAFAVVAQWFADRLARPAPGPGIHPTAVVAADASIDASASIGPYVVVGSGARVEADVRIGAHGSVGVGARVGARTRLAERVTLVDECEIGCDGLVHPGTVIGADGFGFAREPQGWRKIPQLGRALIGDRVEIGANCTIDRGALEDTVIGDGCKLDNQIQVAHNVRIGRDTAIAGCVGIAGSAIIGERCMIGGSAGILGHLEICDDVIISAMALVTRSIRKPGFYSGSFPLMDNAQWERAAATLRHLPDLRARLRKLESLSKDRS